MQSAEVRLDIQRRYVYLQIAVASQTPPEKFPLSASGATSRWLAHRSLGSAQTERGVLHLLEGEFAKCQDEFRIASKEFEQAARLTVEKGPFEEATTSAFPCYIWAVRLSLLAGDTNRLNDILATPLAPVPADIDRRGSQLTSEELLGFKAMLSLLSASDGQASDFAAKLAAIPEKKLLFPSRPTVIEGILQRKPGSFISAMKAMLDRQHRHATNPKAWEHNQPKTFLCFPALELALIALKRELIQIDDLPERSAIVRLRAYPGSDSESTPIGTMLDYHLDYLPHAYLRHLMECCPNGTVPSR